MFFKNYFYFILISVFFVCSCKKSQPTTTSNVSGTSGPVIYVAGYSSDVNNNSCATYWKNGVATLLPKGLNGVATHIAVVGNDIYVSGNRVAANKHSVAVYWKNGVLFDLADSLLSSDTKDILVKGNDVYIVGDIYGRANVQAVATLWKNGISLNLSDGSYEASPQMIIFNGNDLYVFGFIIVDHPVAFYDAVYWKDGVENRVPLGNSLASLGYGIAFSGSSLYLCGDDASSVTQHFIASYWKDGIKTRLADSTSESDAFNIALQGADIYVSGILTATNGITTGILWKNGVATKLGDGSANSVAYGLAIDGNDVYVAGEDVAGYPSYWKNGQLVQLSQAGTKQAVATAITVVPKQ